MNLKLPVPIAAYFDADKVDGEAVARCFTSAAIVKDEGHIYSGAGAIKQWKADVDAKLTYTCEPFALEQTGSGAIVTCHLAGNFPRSPIDLRFIFQLERGKISSLEIVP